MKAFFWWLYFPSNPFLTLHLLSSQPCSSFRVAEEFERRRRRKGGDLFRQRRRRWWSTVATTAQSLTLSLTQRRCVCFESGFSVVQRGNYTLQSNLNRSFLLHPTMQRSPRGFVFRTVSLPYASWSFDQEATNRFMFDTWLRLRYIFLCGVKNHNGETEICRIR